MIEITYNERFIITHHRQRCHKSTQARYDTAYSPLLAQLPVDKGIARAREPSQSLNKGLSSFSNPRHLYSLLLCTVRKPMQINACIVHNRDIHTPCIRSAWPRGCLYAFDIFLLRTSEKESSEARRSNEFTISENAGEYVRKCRAGKQYMEATLVHTCICLLTVFVYNAI
jgi:hypothetical protein